MKDWCAHWEAFPRRFGEREFLRQVGKTFGGVPITETQFETIVEGVGEALDLAPGDRLLDLCCGNGYLTSRLAARCREVVAVDYSRPLVEIARRFHAPANVAYHRLSVLALAQLPGRDRFDKILMYEALQHFRPRDLGPLLEGILARGEGGSLILIASVPDRARRWRFYDTPARRIEFFVRRLRGNEAIGTWWRRATIAAAARRAGLECTFLEQDPSLHTARYRCDVRLRCTSV